VTKADYETVLIPHINEKLKRHKKVRIYAEIAPDFAGLERGAVWEDTKLGFGHFFDWERSALVTDVECMKHSAKFFGFFGFLLPFLSPRWSGRGYRGRPSSQVLLRFPARLFEHAGEKVSERFAWVVLREREVSAGHTELFGALKTRDLLGCQLVRQVAPGGRVVVVFGRGEFHPPRSLDAV
jgi:hypothetical protein